VRGLQLKQSKGFTTGAFT